MESRNPAEGTDLWAGLQRGRPSERIGFEVQLLDGNRIQERVSDPTGQFEFDNLESNRYQLAGVDPALTQRAVDLTQARCGRVLLPLGGL